MTRFNIRISSLFALPMMIIGVTSKSAYVTLEQDKLTVHYGFFRYELPIADIASAEATGWPWYYGLGLRIAPGPTLGCVASTDGVVTLKLSAKRALGSLFGRIGVRFGALAVSLEQPEAFLTALQRTMTQ